MSTSSPDQVQRKLGAKQKREKAVSLRIRGRTWQQVADEVGYSGPASAYAAVQEYFKNYPHPDADEYREVENMKLDYLEQKVHEEYLDKKHVVVTASGKVATRTAGIMTDDNGMPLFDNDGKPVYAYEEVEDHEPVIRGVKTLLDIAARRAKLNGLDTLVVKAEIDDGSVDSEIEALVAEMAGPVQLPEGSNEVVK